MRTYSTILQGSEAVESLALDFARGYDFSEDETEDYNKTFYHDQYVDTIQGIEVYYNRTADYYFFSAENIQND
jgi:hypothetical protein